MKRTVIIYINVKKGEYDSGKSYSLSYTFTKNFCKNSIPNVWRKIKKIKALRLDNYINSRTNIDTNK